MTKMTVREKFDLLNRTNDLNDLAGRMTDGKVFTSKNGRQSVKIDLRERIRRGMEQNGISQGELARRLGKQRSCITSFLSGTIPIPLTDIEEILWILEDGNLMNE